MALDDVVKTTITGPRVEEAMYRTLRWIDRCIAGERSCLSSVRSYYYELSFSYFILCSRLWVFFLVVCNHQTS